MDRFFFLLSTGFARGAIFALFALALVLIWRAARIVNFAQGAMALVATYAAYAVTGRPARTGWASPSGSSPALRSASASSAA